MYCLRAGNDARPNSAEGPSGIRTAWGTRLSAGESGGPTGISRSSWLTWGEVAARSVSGRSLYGKYRLKGKPKVWRSVWTVTKGAVQDFGRDDVMTKAAALAFYSALGLAPTVLLMLTVTAWLRPGTEEAV